MRSKVGHGTSDYFSEQESIPVGCVPSAAVVAGGCVSQHALGRRDVYPGVSA